MLSCPRVALQIRASEQFVEEIANGLVKLANADASNLLTPSHRSGLKYLPK